MNGLLFASVYFLGMSLFDLAQYSLISFSPVLGVTIQLKTDSQFSKKKMRHYVQIFTPVNRVPNNSLVFLVL